MKHPRFVKIALIVAAGVAVASLARAQPDQGVKQVEALVKASDNMVEAISLTKQQLMKTMDVYNALMADEAKDRKKLYRDLQKEMENTQKRRAEITTRAGAMAIEAETLFKGWATSAAAIADESLRKRSEDRLKQTKARYGEIRAEGAKAAQLYDPIMKSLADKVRYLGHDLNAQAVASLKPDTEKLNQEVKQLGKAIDDTMVVANVSMGALRPQ